MEKSRKARRRVHPGGLAFGLGLLVMGAAIGFGLRTAREQDTVDQEPLRKVSPLPAPIVPSTEPPAVPLPDADPPTLSDRQWSDVLEDPGRFALNVGNIRRSATPGWRLLWVERLGGLLGWDQQTMDRVDERVREFDRQLGEAEAEWAEVNHLPGEAFGHHTFRISYDPMTIATGDLLEGLWRDLREVVGERDLERLMVIANPGILLEERGEGGSETVQVEASYNGFSIEVLQWTSDSGTTPAGVFSGSFHGEAAAELAAAKVTPAVDWAGLLDEQEKAFRAVIEDPLSPLPGQTLTDDLETLLADP